MIHFTEETQKEIVQAVRDHVMASVERELNSVFSSSFLRLNEVVTQAFAKRYVEENFAQLAEKMNIEQVVKMAQLRAVGFVVEK